jgi:hypothetical protein
MIGSINGFLFYGWVLRKLLKLVDLGKKYDFGILDCCLPINR